MEKHAYLVIAHNNFNILKKQIMLLDYPYNDIYIHVDAKVKDFDTSQFLNIPKFSKIYFIPRKKVYWADYSLIDVELDLLQYANDTGDYKYFHLISGCDLPIKTQRQIHSFFNNKNNEFVGICPKEVWYSVRRVKYFHLLTGNQMYRKSKFLKVSDRLFEYIQRLFGVNRLRNKEISVIDGWQWFSITKEFSKYLLDNRNFIQDTFNYSISCDEMVIQTMLYNSEFYQRIYDRESLKRGSMRLIDWQRGRPYTFRKEDFDEIMKSNCLFARKFDENTDNDIVDMIFQTIYDKQQKDNL